MFTLSTHRRPTVEVDTYTNCYEIDKIIESVIEEHRSGGYAIGVCIVC